MTSSSSPRHDAVAAKHFVPMAVRRVDAIRPRVIHVYRHAAYPQAIRELKTSGEQGRQCQSRPTPQGRQPVVPIHRGNGPAPPLTWIDSESKSNFRSFRSTYPNPARTRLDTDATLAIGRATMRHPSPQPDAPPPSAPSRPSPSANRAVAKRTQELPYIHTRRRVSPHPNNPPKPKPRARTQAAQPPSPRPPTPDPRPRRRSRHIRLAFPPPWMYKQ